MAPFRDPEPGDLIEIFRVGYQHWAIYVGDGYVVHVAPIRDTPGSSGSSISSVGDGRAVVKLERLEDVVGDCLYKVNNHLDGKYEPLPVKEIIRATKGMVGQELKYSVQRKNCEHFVTKLRYGKSESEQVFSHGPLLSESPRPREECTTLGSVRFAQTRW
ncbi:phospholipase A and acyltransferase 4-like isoform X2 [Sorex araneus]|uniref:phospholipase A and acyltransferase 4-like isoform X2 n=1 Tax=Sorex araneus TaxID=42254 RepID=UPI00243400D8|nr:phospholipase A and acyltransferase 4-like isoform X2 [Sorex araneus]